MNSRNTTIGGRYQDVHARGGRVAGDRGQHSVAGIPAYVPRGQGDYHRSAIPPVPRDVVPRAGPRMLLPQRSTPGPDGDAPNYTQHQQNPQPKTKRISIKETESGTTTIQISDIL